MISDKSYPRVYIALIAMGCLVVMGVGLPRAFLPIMAHKLDPTGTLVGFVLAAWFISRAFIELPSSFLIAKIGKRQLLIGGIFCA